MRTGNRSKVIITIAAIVVMAAAVLCLTGCNMQKTVDSLIKRWAEELAAGEQLQDALPEIAANDTQENADAVPEIAGNDTQEDAEALTEYWSADSTVAQQLRDYVEKVTNPDDKDNYIPVEDRIAVFDMDGTLTCETFFTYYDTMMFIEYCLYDHPERVSDELKEVAASLRPGYTADEALARNFAKAYAGMTVEELYDYATEFGQKSKNYKL